MKVTIEIPDDLYEGLQEHCEHANASMEEIIVASVRRHVPTKLKPISGGHRVKLPLIHSSAPGTFPSLTNSEIDDLLG